MWKCSVAFLFHNPHSMFLCQTMMSYSEGRIQRDGCLIKWGLLTGVCPDQVYFASHNAYQNTSITLLPSQTHGFNQAGAIHAFRVNGSYDPQFIAEAQGRMKINSFLNPSTTAFSLRCMRERVNLHRNTQRFGKKRDTLRISAVSLSSSIQTKLTAKYISVLYDLLINPFHFFLSFSLETHEDSFLHTHAACFK